MGHKEAIIDFMVAFGSITARQAEDCIGCMRTAARINELRKVGFPIKTEMITVPVRDGKTARVACYSLPEGFVVAK